MEINGIGAALDALDGATVSGREIDLGGDYILVRPYLDALVAALGQAGAVEARIGRVIENLMAGAETLVGMPAHTEGDIAVTGATAATGDSPG